MKFRRVIGSVAAGVFAAAVAAGVAGCAENPVVTACYDVVPRPASVEAGADGVFMLDGNTVIAYPEGNDSLRGNAELLAGYIRQLTGSELKLTTDTAAKGAIVLAANLDNANREAYRLEVSPRRIVVDGASAAGNFYGIQTLRKSIPEAGKLRVEFPAAVIADAPRFGYRGAMLDVARHFFPVDSVKKFIDMIALHNINTLHWHLTDDQGWRLEIMKYPRLTEVGSKRAGTCIGHDFGTSDSIPYGGFYTQAEARDIVDYAAARHIRVIPEIDLPGHMVAALTAYPNLGCTGGPYEVWQRWGVADDVLCAGNDSTYAFIADVLNEVADVFPSEYIHIGGDECPKNRWENCPRCQARIRELGLKPDAAGTAEQKLQSAVMAFAGEVLGKRGRRVIGWDEILEGGAAPDATIMSWRGKEGGREAARLGHDAVMTPVGYCYFDYYQKADRSTEPEAIGGFLPIDTVYAFEPVPDGLSPEEASHILGAQANLWTEYIPTFSQAMYMELPRLAAMSEVQWCAKEARDFGDFRRRLPQMVRHYEVLGLNHADF